MPWNETHVCIITSGPGILSPVAGCQLSGGRSKVGSNYFPRKIGTGMPIFLCREWDGSLGMRLQVGRLVPDSSPFNETFGEGEEPRSGLVSFPDLAP